MSIPLPARRLLLVFAVAAAGLAAGLSDAQWIDLRAVDPARAVDSETVRARGFPHAWWVVHPQDYGLAPTPRRIATRNLLQSAFFWLACSAVTVAVGVSVVRKLRRVRGRLSGDTTGVRVFAALATAGCAAGYADLFAGIVDLWPMAAATSVALLSPLLLIRSRDDLRRRWLSIVLLLTISFLVVISFDLSVVDLLLAVGIFLTLSLAVALAFLYSLTAPTPNQSTRVPVRGSLP